ncbi:unnamed protein product [Albugo candida]|uniref:Uncharacterized protein n=1 Tax=Albugo candida TaxID=65357 RepID=A0A024GFB5_9STRA|nr:unnamed protein product [Albugo candida]|eukprot:CCI45027.1 unnamed protein product [Albugo candida]
MPLQPVIIITYSSTSSSACFVALLEEKKEIRCCLLTCNRITNRKLALLTASKRKCNHRNAMKHLRKIQETIRGRSHVAIKRWCRSMMHLRWLQCKISNWLRSRGIGICTEQSDHLVCTGQIHQFKFHFVMPFIHSGIVMYLLRCICTSRPSKIKLMKNRSCQYSCRQRCCN